MSDNAPDPAPLFVERTRNALVALHYALSDESGGISFSGAAGKPTDTDFARAVRKCMLLFYWLKPFNAAFQWEDRYLSQAAAEQVIAGAVRTLVATYAASGTSRDLCSPDAQKHFDELTALLREYWPPKPTGPPKEERLKELLKEMRRLIAEFGHLLDEPAAPTG